MPAMGERIKLTIDDRPCFPRCTEDMDVNVQFSLGLDTPLRKLMRAYCQRFNVSELDVVFLAEADGMLEIIRRHETCASRDLSEGDVIVVYPALFFPGGEIERTTER